MSRISIPTRDDAPAASIPILDEINRKFGVIPNLFRLLAISPKALEAYAGLNGTLTATFDAKIREQVAIAVAQVNACDYCLSAHTYLGTNLAGLTATDVKLNRQGSASDPRTAAIVRFAARVTEQRGHLANDELAAARNAGLSDAELVEIVALVADNVFTNFVNSVAQTDIDFPVVQASEAA
jgi:uncharacterized peroxidase-related enzyme